VGEDLSEMWPNAAQNLTPIGKAPTEKSVTVEKKKGTVNLVSRVSEDCSFRALQMNILHYI